MKTEDNNYSLKVKHKCADSSICRPHVETGCFINIYASEILFSLNLSSSRCSHIGLLFTSKEQEMVCDVIDTPATHITTLLVSSQIQNGSKPKWQHS